MERQIPRFPHPASINQIRIITEPHRTSSVACFSSLSLHVLDDGAVNGALEALGVLTEFLLGAAVEHGALG